MAKIITVNGTKYAAVETTKFPEIGSQSWGHFMNCDYPTVCDRIEETQADDGQTICLAHFVRKSNNEDEGSAIFVLKKEE